VSVIPPVIVFFVGTFIYLGIRTIFKRRLSKVEKSVNKSSFADMSLVVLVGLSQVGIPALFVALPIFAWADHHLSLFSFLLGSALMLGGIWLFWRSHVDLGKNWSVALELGKDHRLITAGVYRAIRHPMYASFFLMAFAQAALLPNWFSGLSALFAVSLLYLVRKPQEEAMMLNHFGFEYESYMAKSGGVFPKLFGIGGGSSQK
jgi:protein-S-isoprenylcysteine O-methyltransferase Ste14